jgi:hypothetical protein
MTSDHDIIEQLVKYGYLPGVSAVDAASLDIRHKVVADALAAYQDFCRYPLDRMVRQRHGRPLQADGLVGPATRELFKLPRCEVPDFGPNSGNERAGSGSWPMPCQKAGIKIHFDWTSAPSATKSKAAQLERDIIAIWGRVGLSLVKVATAAEANIYVWHGGFVGGTIGTAYFNQGRCSDRVSCKISSSYVGENRGLIKHETGHNNGLGHTRGGTMNSYILDEEDPNGLWLPSDPSWPTIVRYFDGKPVPLPVPDDYAMPPPPDVPDGPPVTPVPPPVTPPVTPRWTLRDWLKYIFGDLF